MKDIQIRWGTRGFLFLCVAMLAHSTTLTRTASVTAQVSVEAATLPSNVQERKSKYRSVINQLAKVESDILQLRSSDTQREFDKLESTLIQLQAKRKRLSELERQWTLLSDGTPALEVEPRLNRSELAERQMLLELESSKEKVLRLRTDLMKLKNEFGPGHPEIQDTARKLADLDSVVEKQTEALESLGVEVKSSIAKQKLKKALLRREELKAKFGPGHPDVANIESEVGMLQAEVSFSPSVPASHGPSIELVNATLELKDAASKFGNGHPALQTLERKVEVLEKLARSEAAAEAPDNKRELAKRLEARIGILQDRILAQEAELDSVRDQQKRFADLEQKNVELLKERTKLNAQLDKFLPELEPAAELAEEEQVRLRRQLLNGIDALESLGKSAEANRVREILSGIDE